MNMLEKIEQLNKQIIENIINNRKYYKLLKEYNELVIEYNKLNNVYWNYDFWITDIFNNIVNKAEGLTGNDLTNYVANELNKLNGVMLEKIIDNGKINYSVEVITPYTIYHYILYRGYDEYVSLKADKYSDGTNKSRTSIHPVKNHICEIAFAEKNSLEELREKWNRNILDKPLINKIKN